MDSQNGDMVRLHTTYRKWVKMGHFGVWGLGREWVKLGYIWGSERVSTNGTQVLETPRWAKGPYPQIYGVREPPWDRRVLGGVPKGVQNGVKIGHLGPYLGVLRGSQRAPNPRYGPEGPNGG